MTSAPVETSAAGGDTVSRLRRSAERLFAEHGVDGVSLRQITKEAGQRNVTAVNYHFGSRDGLLRAVLEYHLAELRIRHRTLVDRYLENPPEDPADRLRELADALVMPACAELECAHGGPDFLRIAAEVVNRSDWVVAPGTPISELITHQHGWGDLVEPLMPGSDDAATGRLHRRFAAMRFVYVELGRRARQPQPRRDDRLFASQLTDLVTGLLTAPLSSRTLRLLKNGPKTPERPA